MTRVIRPIRIEGNVAYVPLTKGYEAVIDAVDLPIVEGLNWCARVRPNTVYAVRRVPMHRVIMGEPDGLEVDHIDGDGLNNRRNNLRVATRAQNVRNQRIRSCNTSGFKGVTWNKHAKKWRAQIRINGKLKYLGYFTEPEAAHGAYCKASAEFHGEFGRTE